jgi:hypothetical protein
MQDDRYCYITGRTDTLQLHHIFTGPRRKLSDQWGCWCWLAADVHAAAHDSNQELLTQLRQECQEKFETLYGHEKFMEVFGKSYL